MILEKLTALRDSLGETAGEVAESLRKRGCRGRKKDPWGCPLADVLRREFPGLDEVLAGRVNLWAGGEFVIHSPATQSFLINFDRGFYPDLEVGVEKESLG